MKQPGVDLRLYFTLVSFKIYFPNNRKNVFKELLLAYYHRQFNSSGIQSWPTGSGQVSFPIPRGHSNYTWYFLAYLRPLPLVTFGYCGALTLAPCDVTFFDRNNKAFWDVLKRKFLPWKMTNYVLKNLIYSLLKTLKF